MRRLPPPLPRPAARPAPAAVTLAETRLSGSPVEALVKSLTRLYKLLGATAKAQLAPKGVEQRPPMDAFADLVSWVNSTCSPAVYAFLQARACACLPAWLPAA